MGTLADSEYIVGHLGTVIGVGWAVNVGANDFVRGLGGWLTLGEPVFRAVHQGEPLRIVYGCPGDEWLMENFEGCNRSSR
jgi:hypothetical protein